MRIEPLLSWKSSTSRLRMLCAVPSTPMVNRLLMSNPVAGEIPVMTFEVNTSEDGCDVYLSE